MESVRSSETYVGFSLARPHGVTSYKNGLVTGAVLTFLTYVSSLLQHGHEALCNKVTSEQLIVTQRLKNGGRLSE